MPLLGPRTARERSQNDCGRDKRRGLFSTRRRRGYVRSTAHREADLRIPAPRARIPVKNKIVCVAFFLAYLFNHTRVDQASHRSFSHGPMFTRGLSGFLLTPPHHPQKTAHSQRPEHLHHNQNIRAGVEESRPPEAVRLLHDITPHKTEHERDPREHENVRHVSRPHVRHGEDARG